MPFPAAKYPKELREEVGRACLKMSIAEVQRQLAAGSWGVWGAVQMPYSTVAHYAGLERKRQRLLASQRGLEAVEARTDRLARRVLDLAEGRIERWDATGKFSPRELVEVADLLGRVNRVASGKAPAKPDEVPSDPLTVALLGDRAVVATSPT